MEVKTEPMDEVIIKYEPYEETNPEFVDVSEDLLSASIKCENEAEEEQPIQDPIQDKFITTNQHHTSTISPSFNQNPSDLSIFWEPFQEDHPRNQIPEEPVTNVTQHMNFYVGKLLLHSICGGHTSLKLPAGFKMYFIKDLAEFNLLIAQMTVEDGLPVMKRQILINSALQVSLFFGTRKITNISLCKWPINGVKCIRLLVERFAKFKWCRGLSAGVRIERWSSLMMLDSLHDTHKFRHLHCKSVHRNVGDQCRHCKYLETRDKKIALVKRQCYVTCSMLTNYKYWRGMQQGVRRLKMRIKRLQMDKNRLKRELQRVQSNRVLINEENNLQNDEIKLEIHYDGVRI